MSIEKNEYIKLINNELQQLDDERTFRILYLLARKCREEGAK